MHNENWDDLRYVLAVVEHGSVLQAARQLAVNHATVLRRVAAFEERFGTALFERTATGYRLLPDRLPIIRAAQEAKIAMDQVGRVASGGRDALKGTVRLTSTDTLCTAFLPGVVAQLRRDLPHIELTVLSNNSYLDLMREEAHLTIRPATSLPPELVGEIHAQLGVAAYIAPGAPEIWLRMTGPLSRSLIAQKQGELLQNAPRGVASDSFITLREFAGQGLGIASLPCILGDADPRLTRYPAPEFDIQIPLWLARHRDMIPSQRVRVVERLLRDRLEAERAVLAGIAA